MNIFCHVLCSKCDCRPINHISPFSEQTAPISEQNVQILVYIFLKSILYVLRISKIV